MNRFKFRVWDGENIVSPDYISRDGYAHWKANSIPNISNNIMQCTGLKDCEGKDIYEGDIVEVILNPNYPTPHICTIVFKGMGFWFMDVDEELFVFSPETYKVKVIGNIYQNKDLLNER